jgi:hypothetical protein
VGLDRLIAGIATIGAVLVFAGCDSDDRPDNLLYGQPAAEFTPVDGSVITSARTLPGTTLGRRFLVCKPPSVSPDALVVERIGVFGESLTFVDRAQRTLHACDGGTDPAGERQPPWCSTSAGRLFQGRLLDPRLDIGCRDRGGGAIAYAWVESVAGARWVAVDQGGYDELYPVLTSMPVRVATTEHIDLAAARARFDITQYDEHGTELMRGQIDARVAG